MFNVETGVPRPRKMGRPSPYPWASLEVDQSFFVPEGVTNLGAIAAAWARRHAPEKKFSVYKVEGGFRAWRIK